MPEYRPLHPRTRRAAKPKCRPTYLLRPDAAEMAETKGCLKSCGHAPGYRCCCRAHQDSEQDCQDCYDEMTMPIGYKLARAYSQELTGFPA